jgi:hypothetical protein
MSIAVVAFDIILVRQLFFLTYNLHDSIHECHTHGPTFLQAIRPSGNLNNVHSLPATYLILSYVPC